MVKNNKVLIVGAGPAGASTAFFLKHFDKDNIFNVDLIERLTSDKFNRYHDMCGEAISDELLKEIHPLQPEGLTEKIHTIQEHWPGDIAVKTKMNGHLINRIIFLQSIVEKFQKNGGNYKIGAMSSLIQKKDQVKVKINETSKIYDYVIGADGPNSLIRKILGLKAKQKLFLQYVVDKQPTSGTLTFYYDEKYNGDYMWEFPHEENVKIGFPVSSNPPPSIINKIMLKQSKYISYGGLQHYTIGKVLLVGDAAAQTNAITKGGIRSAMIAGKIAAESIVNNNPLSYEQRWLQTNFSSKIFLKAFEQLQNMPNSELENHMKPYAKGISIFSTMQILLFYRKYLPLYKAYALANKVGW